MNPWIAYQKRLQRVTDHIHAHLDEELDLDRLAEIACMSNYHWHRIYRAVVGETPAMTGLHRAAGELVSTARPVAEIAKAAVDVQIWRKPMARMVRMRGRPLRPLSLLSGENKFIPH